MIAHGVGGWELAEFSREVRGPDIIEHFLYERHAPDGAVTDKAVGLRLEGETTIVCQELPPCTTT